MKFVQVPPETPEKTLDEIRKGLIEEFRKPKSEVQYITELKEIKQYPNEIVWDFDQRFKTLMARLDFDMSEVQHVGANPTKKTQSIGVPTLLTLNSPQPP